MTHNDCHSWNLSRLEGRYERVPGPLSEWLPRRLMRVLGPSLLTRLRMLKHKAPSWLGRRPPAQRRAAGAASTAPAPRFAPGDLVRVRSREEIAATLDARGMLRGCGLMEGMWQYCGTTQQVFKPVTRFLNESDYQVKSARGLVLLQNLTCEGTAKYGRCDRACFYFWREEWLEPVDGTG